MCGSYAQVHNQYISLAKSMMHFEKQWFSQWQANVDQIAMHQLKQPILREDPDTHR